MVKNVIVILIYLWIYNFVKVAVKVDILVVVIGCVKFVIVNFVKLGVVVIDVGMNCDENGKFCGDVDYEVVVLFVSYIMLVFGGVGFMIIIMLME